MKKQVHKSHYEFNRYIDKRRWCSVWHQLDEVMSQSPQNVLEIGPGPGLFAAMARVLGVDVETLDLDPELAPDYVAAADQMPFKDNVYDVVCAFQMLEHVPYQESLEIFKEMARVSKKSIVISLPDARGGWPYSMHIPVIGSVSFVLPLPWKGLFRHRFDGEHYWELNRKGFSLKRVKEDLELSGSVRLTKTYKVPEKPYHRFFVFCH